MNNVTNKKYFTNSIKGIFKKSVDNTRILHETVCSRKIGIELERVGDSSDPVEGSNITLICRVIFPEVKYAAPPEWAYQIKNSAKMQVIDETNLPEGLRKNLNLFFWKIVIWLIFKLIRYSDNHGGRKTKAQH